MGFERLHGTHTQAALVGPAIGIRFDAPVDVDTFVAEPQDKGVFGIVASTGQIVAIVDTGDDTKIVNFSRSGTPDFVLGPDTAVDDFQTLEEAIEASNEDPRPSITLLVKGQPGGYLEILTQSIEKDLTILSWSSDFAQSNLDAGFDIAAGVSLFLHNIEVNRLSSNGSAAIINAGSFLYHRVGAMTCLTNHAVQWLSGSSWVADRLNSVLTFDAGVASVLIEDASAGFIETSSISHGDNFDFTAVLARAAAHLRSFNDTIFFSKIIIEDTAFVELHNSIMNSFEDSAFTLSDAGTGLFFQNLGLVFIGVDVGPPFAFEGVGTVEFSGLEWLRTPKASIFEDTIVILARVSTHPLLMRLAPTTVSGTGVDVPLALTTFQINFTILTDTTAVKLPAAPVPGEEHIIKDKTGLAAMDPAIVVDGNGNDIDGVATRSIEDAFGWLHVKFNGTDWDRISQG